MAAPFSASIVARFGKEFPDKMGEVRDCDFSQAKLFHLCDFLVGSEIGSLRWPTWPHIVVTDLENCAADWLQLKLPEELTIVQGVIGEGPPPRAVTIFLPAETQRASELREIFATQPYIIAAEPSDPSG
jgi:hypothetical protein